MAISISRLRRCAIPPTALAVGGIAQRIVRGWSVWAVFFDKDHGKDFYVDVGILPRGDCGEVSEETGRY